MTNGNKTSEEKDIEVGRSPVKVQPQFAGGTGRIEDAEPKGNEKIKELKARPEKTK